MEPSGGLGITGPAVIVLSGTAALCVVAYFAASRSDVDGTTEVAALVVLTSGILAGLGSYRLGQWHHRSNVPAAGREDPELHSLVARIDDVALRAGVRFGVMALVVSRCSRRVLMVRSAASGHVNCGRWRCSSPA